MSKRFFEEVKNFEQLATEWNAAKYFTFLEVPTHWFVQKDVKKMLYTNQKL